jgi:hypothetical protein
MKKGILSMAVFLIAAMMVFGLASLSFAQEQTNGGPGDALIFPYYDVRSVADGGLGLTDNYFAVINNSEVWVQSHVRVRTGRCSVELLDFDIMQSPKDVFVFDLYRDPDGGITFASCDKNTLEDSGFNLNYDADHNVATGDAEGDDCHLLKASNFSDMLSLITTCGDCDTGGTITVAQALELVQKGYIEVIEEGVVQPKSTDKTLCYDNAGDDPAAGVTIPGKTLRDLWDTTCTEDIYAPEAELQGRQYFVEVNHTVAPVIVKRLAQANAAILDYNSEHGLILHENTYEDELAAAECNADDGSERCYAYAAAETADAAGAKADGANDLNRCFYVDKIGTDPVINKFGAAATFGPTLADIYSPRNGYLYVTAPNLYNSGLSAFDSVQYFTTVADNWTKQYVDSHYFYAPLPGRYDMMTAFAFTFPLKHFIGENETIEAVELYDNSENQKTIDIGKFISPGLPTEAIPSEEANIFRLAPPYNEGWIRYEVSATNSTTGCDDLFDYPIHYDCEVWFYDVDYEFNVPPSTKYVPAYMGLVFTTGSENIGVSPFVYNNENIKWGDNGQSGDSR